MTRVGRSFLPCVRIADPKIDCQGASCVGTLQLGFRLWGAVHLYCVAVCGWELALQSQAVGYIRYCLSCQGPECVKPVLNWANVCSPEHTSDTSTNYDSFLN